MGFVPSAGPIELGLALRSSSFAYFGKCFISAYGNMGNFSFDRIHDVSICKIMASLAGWDDKAFAFCFIARTNKIVEIDVPVLDEEGVLLEAPPESYENNLESVRFTIRAEPLSSPFYQRPVGIASHPRVIFEPSSTEADLIVEWLTRGAP